MSNTEMHASSPEVSASARPRVFTTSFTFPAFVAYLLKFPDVNMRFSRGSQKGFLVRNNRLLQMQEAYYILYTPLSFLAPLNPHRLIKRTTEGNIVWLIEV